MTISKNNYQGLQKTLESVKEQDYKIIEHIVIDGDSDDGSKELLESYTHSKKYVYSSEIDNGISSAFNKGLDRSNGDLIFFLNAGDVLVSNTIVSEVVKSYLTHKWKCGVGGRISSNYAEEEVLYYPPKLTSNFLKYFMFLPHQGFFCETSLHRNYKFDESIKTSMDYELFLRMLKDIEIFYLPFVISKCQPGGVSSQSRKRVIEQSGIRLKQANRIHEKFIISILNTLILLKSDLKISSPFALKNESIKDYIN
ncbi:glycosyltransferase family 2 protein [Aetokthonos hydrillicola]|uniref:glycosyltransferase family 2 protein n=1 Tax=Aetokthonos hydrillicola TaxID=1550245 RepID=UPI001ABB02BB|nr:glycosyltransferase family 2 protein [Aetokthonos hydrillicola]MBW4589168.1 glycosyltransferase [Aetokthonos hydrillicola CCALA 1050]